METKANYVAVGAFVLTFIFGVVVTLLWFAGVQYNQEYQYIQTSFKGPVTGLGKGTTVRYNGIDVGRVEALRFAPDDPQLVVATLQVQPNLSIRQDAEASIEMQGLTGGTYVEIDGGAISSPLLTAQSGQQYPEIRAKASDLQLLEESVPKMVAKLSITADRINDLLNDQNRKELSGTLANLNVLTRSLANDTSEFTSTLDNLSDASRKLGPLLSDADRDMNKVGKLSDDADRFVNGPALAEIPDIAVNIKRLLGSVTKLSDDLDQDPTKLFFGDRRKGYAPR